VETKVDIGVVCSNEVLDILGRSSGSQKVEKTGSGGRERYSAAFTIK